MILSHQVMYSFSYRRRRCRYVQSWQRERDFAAVICNQQAMYHVNKQQKACLGTNYWKRKGIFTAMSGNFLQSLELKQILLCHCFRAFCNVRHFILVFLDRTVLKDSNEETVVRTK